MFQNQAEVKPGKGGLAQGTSRRHSAWLAVKIGFHSICMCVRKDCDMHLFLLLEASDFREYPRGFGICLLQIWSEEPAREQTCLRSDLIRLETLYSIYSIPAILVAG